MKRVIVTLAFGEYLRWGEELTLPKIRAYAERYGWDFLLQNSLQRHTGGYSDYVWTMFEVIHQLLSVYDRLFCVPVDCIIKPDARDLLPAMPGGTFYGFDEYAITPGNAQWVWDYAFANWSKEFPRSEDVPRHLYNTGPMVVDRSHLPLFAPPENEPTDGMMEMALVNMRLHKYGMAHRDMKPEWFNATNMLDGVFPDFLHVMGHDGTKESGVRKFLPLMGWT